MADEPDPALVRRALGGDQGAFTQLARRHGPRLARTVRALGVPAAEVEDVTQAALVAAWRGLASYDPSRPFAAWACVIAANKARDWARQHQRRVRWLSAAPLEGREALNVVDRGAVVDPTQKDRLRRVARAIDRLPHQLKTPLVLISVSELSQAEAASALGVSQKTVETRVARARKQLAKLLGAE